MGTEICNSGNVEVDYFAMPNTDHPVLAQNLYRMSGSTDRLEQIGYHRAVELDDGLGLWERARCDA